ncbi:MAG: acyl-CoA/acyl-ACP dehydrogenase [Myxococcales bacterium]|nr:acyl-CoA/acyl-ACP dehydrogenase [Myxococcales bacterium]MDD9969806.1 acyl-CoA/acyl-ACP dehydrogenase [Myxococcales bacterium]
MDFTLSDEQKMLVNNVENFVKKDSPISRFRAMRDSETGFSEEVWQHMAELGWLGLPIPEAAQGLGLPFIDTALVLEQLGKTLVPEPFVPSVVLGGMAIAKTGSSEQQARFLGPMMEGSSKLALAYAEAASRYLPNYVETTAQRGPDGYLLEGRKLWVLSGDSADTLVVSARTGGKPGDAEGVSLFVVDANQKDVTRTSLKTIDGRRAAHVELAGAQGELLGNEGAALPVLEEVLDLGAAAACAEGAGLLQAVFTMTRDYLEERQQFGSRIGAFQALQHRCVDMFVELELCKSAMLLAALRAESEDISERKRSISVAKSQLAMGGHFVTRQAIQLHGGIGVTDEHDVGLYFKRLNALSVEFGDEAYHLGRLAEAY